MGAGQGTMGEVVSTKLMDTLTTGLALLILLATHRGMCHLNGASCLSMIKWHERMKALSG